MDNSDDNYNIYITGPGNTNTGDMSFTATYVANGEYLVNYVPQVSGEFVLTVTLRGIELEDSPWALTIIPGEIDPALCVTDVSSTAVTLEAGLTYFFIVTTKDVFANLLTEGIDNIDYDIIAEYQSTTFTSPIGMADYANLASEFGHDVAGIASDNGDGTYNC